MMSCGGTSSTDGAQADPDESIDRAKHQHDTGTLGLWEQLAETKDDGPFVLVQDLDRADGVEHQQDQEYQHRGYRQALHQSAPFGASEIRRLNGERQSIYAGDANRVTG